MFYDNLKAICDKNNIKITPLVLDCGGTKGVIGGCKKGATPNSDIVMMLSVRLNVPTDVLLFGKEKNSTSEQLTADEQELLTYYRQLNDKSQGILLGRAEAMAENQQNIDTNMSANKPYIAKTIVYSRSTNNMPSRVETGDLSDIINAPDSTDEY